MAPQMLLFTSVPFAFLYFLSNYAFVTALAITSVASALTLEQVQLHRVDQWVAGFRVAEIAAVEGGDVKSDTFATY